MSSVCTDETCAICDKRKKMPQNNITTQNVLIIIKDIVIYQFLFSYILTKFNMIETKSYHSPALIFILLLV